MSASVSNMESGVSAHPRPIHAQANAPAPPTYQPTKLRLPGPAPSSPTNRPATARLAINTVNHSPFQFCLVFHISSPLDIQLPQPAQSCLETITTTIPSHCKLPPTYHSIPLPSIQASSNPRSSPQGRIFQIEYAAEAVKLGSVVVGIVSKTHAVMCAVKVSSWVMHR